MAQSASKKVEQAEYMRSIWHEVPAAGTPLESVLDPKYWVHVSSMFKPRDRIEVDAEDGSYFAELMVIDAGRLFAKVELMRKHEFSAPEVAGSAESPYEVKWAGRAKWRVVRKIDRAPLRDGFDDRQSAELWAASHARAAA